jgi:hypothetical protein
MRTFVASAIVVCCGLQGAYALPAPPSAPCPDPEREFVEITLTRLVRHGFIDQRNRIADREARPRGPLDAACRGARPEGPHGDAASASGVSRGDRRAVGLTLIR